MSIDSVKFRGRHHSWRAIIFLIVGSLALVAFFVMSFWAALHEGAVFSFGIIGLLTMAATLAGVIICARAMNERDVFISLPIAGIAVNGVAFLIYLIAYVVGLV